MRWLLYLAVVATVVATTVWVVSSLRRPRALPPADTPPQVGPGPDWSPPAPASGPGWFPDPLGAHRLRWWDGRAWTERTSD